MRKKKFYLLQENTDWPNSYQCNFVYVFESKPTSKIPKALGYFNGINEEVFWFSKPIPIDMRGRKFVQVGI